MAGQRWRQRQVCVSASTRCMMACLYTSGKDAITYVQNARIAKTQRLFKDGLDHPRAFITERIGGIVAHVWASGQSLHGLTDSAQPVLWPLGSSARTRGTRNGRSRPGFESVPTHLPRTVHTSRHRHRIPRRCRLGAAHVRTAHRASASYAAAGEMRQPSRRPIGAAQQRPAAASPRHAAPPGTGSA